MKNAWALYDPVTNELLGTGDGAIDPDLIGNAVVRFRDDPASVEAELSVQARRASQLARFEIGDVNSSNRAQAFAMKELCARQFLAGTVAVVDKTLTGVAGVNAIDPVLYSPLRKEYEATHHLIAWTPWELAQAIVDRADAAMDMEVACRVKKLNAELLISQPAPPIADE